MELLIEGFISYIVNRSQWIEQSRELQSERDSTKNDAISDSNISNDTGLSSFKNHQNQNKLFLEFESCEFGKNNICRPFGGVLTREVHDFKYDD